MTKLAIFRPKTNRKHQNILMILVMGLVAITGVYFLSSSFAANSFITYEPETAQLSNGAQSVSDTTASGGSYALLRGLNLTDVGPATDYPAWTDVFAHHQTTRGWIGGDSNSSIGLPDGRKLFVFADTLIGTTDSKNVVASGWKLPPNSLVTTDSTGGNFKTYVGGPTGQETGYIPNPSARPSNRLWPFVVLNDGDTIQIFLDEWQPDSKGAFGFTFTGNTWIAQLNISTLAVEKTTQIISNDLVQWGSTGYQDQDYNYIIGHLDTSAPTIYTYMFRSPRGKLTESREYRTATGWSADRNAATAISNVNIQAVTQLANGTFQGLFMDNQLPKYVRKVSAAQVYGPWTVSPDNVFSIPESSITGILTYMPRIHQMLSDSSGYVMSYSVNAFNINDVLSHASYYQPHFIKGPAAK